jgi:hypothetical protein
MKQRLAIAAACAAAAAAFDTFAIVLIFADALLTIAWFIPQFRKEKWTFLKGLTATAVVAVILLMFAYSLQTRRRLEGFATGGGGLASVAEPLPVTGEAKDYFDEASRQQKALRVGSGDTTSNQELNYQGLPARFEIPEGERHGYFGQEMLPTDREQAVRVLLVSSSIVWLIGVILVALALAAIWRSRVALAAGLRERLVTETPEVDIAV